MADQYGRNVGLITLTLGDHNPFTVAARHIAGIYPVHPTPADGAHTAVLVVGNNTLVTLNGLNYSYEDKGKDSHWHVYSSANCGSVTQ